MDRIKKIEEVIIGEGEVLVELIEKDRKSGIILSNDKKSKLSEGQTNSYGIILAVGSAINDLKPGDIVLRTKTEKAPGYDYKGKNLIMVSRYNIAIAIKPENFDSTDEISV